MTFVTPVVCWVLGRAVASGAAKMSHVCVVLAVVQDPPPTTTTPTGLTPPCHIMVSHDHMAVGALGL